MNYYKKLNKITSISETRNIFSVISVVLIIFTNSLSAERKGVRLVEFQPKKTSFSSIKPPSAKKAIKTVSFEKKSPPVKPTKVHKSIVTPKKEEPEKEQITNIERIYEGKEYVVKIRARKFRQGELMFVRLQPSNPETSLNELQKYNLFWMKKKVEMFLMNNEYMGFIPIHPELHPGTYDLEIRTEEIKETYKVCPVQIEANKFKETRVTETLKLPKRFAPGKGSGGPIKFILECEKLKRAAFQSETIPSFTQNFHLPAKIKKITSNFYARRNYFKKKGKPHGGIDIRGATGDPIHAIQDGKVVISRPMYFEGIFTVIDHGSKIFSLYMHQSETLVREGETVKRGQLIGKIGSTGMSTGPHLHLGLKVDNVLVNPMSAIHLKIF